MDSFLKTVTDDGKGRTLNRPARPIPMKLVTDVVEKGDYTFIGLYDYMHSLIMACPFCGQIVETQFLLCYRVTVRSPLTLSDELTCPKCTKRFHVIDGLAIESWI